MFGFLGKSARDGYWRLYLSPDLGDFVDIPEDAIIHREQLDRERSTLGGTIIWIRREANIVHTRIESREAQAEFLQGGITAAYFRGARAGALLGRNALMGHRLGDTDVTVCRACDHSEFAPVCTLATSCHTTVPTDRGCGGVIGF